MKIKMYLYILALTVFLGCWENNNPPKDNRILWETEIIGGDETASDRILPLIFDDNVVISRANFDRSQSALMCFDKNTGTKKWEWTDTYFNSEGTEIPIELYTKLLSYNNIIIGLDYNKMYGINANIGQTVWENEFDSQISDRFFLYDDKVYMLKDDNYSTNKLTFLELNPLDGSYNVFYDVQGYEEGYNIVSGPFLIYKNIVGDKCILHGVAHNKDLYTTNETWKYGMICYNLDKQEIVFKQSYPYEVGLSYLYINDDKIYSTGNYFSQYELSTGNLIEQFKQDQSTIDYTTLYDYPYAYLMYNNTSNRLVKVNMITMKEVGRLSLDGDQSYTIKEWKDDLYLHTRSGRIYVVDKDNFQVVEKITAPHYDENSYYSFDENFSIDEETGYMYCTDYKHLICYDLNK
ncbi:MAG: hypothetical protein R2771_13050 [Saprospiraceae bacterium]